MTESAMMNVELTVNDMEKCSGGYARLPKKEGFIVYKIVSSDTLIRIARRYRCTVNDLLNWNPKITNRNLIYAGDYLYIKA